MKLSAEQFQELFQKSGGKMTSKGRPIINLEVLYGKPEKAFKGNRKVMNAMKVVDQEGRVLADSRWEYMCKEILKECNVDFTFQQKFELLPTIRRESLPTLRKRVWSPDFTFHRHKLVADAKGHITEVAKLKIHLFLYLYPEWDVVLLQNKNQLYNLIKNLKEHESRQDFQ